MAGLTPNLKDRLWHKMRLDLERYVGRDMPADRLLCPTCARWLPYEGFSVEHIVPQQALDDDPPGAKAAMTLNERTPLTLLCTAPLIMKVKGERLPREVFNSGCNNWKGRLYDKSIRRVLNGDALANKYRGFTDRETIGCMVVCYLALFHRFGYHVVATPSGLIMRSQFFNPNRFVPSMPVMCQMIMTGATPPYDAGDLRFWRSPISFKYERDRSSCMVAVRNVVAHLPCSRDPEAATALHLPYAPARYVLRPDFTTIFLPGAVPSLATPGPPSQR